MKRRLFSHPHLAVAAAAALVATAANAPLKLVAPENVGGSGPAAAFGAGFGGNRVGLSAAANLATGGLETFFVASATPPHQGSTTTETTLLSVHWPMASQARA